MIHLLALLWIVASPMLVAPSNLDDMNPLSPCVLIHRSLVWARAADDRTPPNPSADVSKREQQDALFCRAKKRTRSRICRGIVAAVSAAVERNTVTDKYSANNSGANSAQTGELLGAGTRAIINNDDLFAIERTPVSLPEPLPVQPREEPENNRNDQETSSLNGEHRTSMIEVRCRGHEAVHTDGRAITSPAKLNKTGSNDQEDAADAFGGAKRDGYHERACDPRAAFSITMSRPEMREGWRLVGSAGARDAAHPSGPRPGDVYRCYPLSDDDLWRSRRMVPGDLARLQAVIRRAREGQRVVVAVLGGSTTNGGGCQTYQLDESHHSTGKEST